jgi:DeoR family transcriptional regulator, suf operon transcriptional repressor
VKIPGWRRRFQASTRGKILTLLRVESLTVNELAEALELTDNAVRSHLTGLERDGLIQQQGMRRGFRKPHILYSLTAEAGYLFPTAYGSLLHHVLVVFGGRLSPRELRTILREVGRAVAKEYLDHAKDKTGNQRIEFALGVLKTLGGDVTVRESEGKRFIFENGCALAAVTVDHPEACLIVEALLTEIIGSPVKERCHHGEATRCCFEISA